LLIGCPGAAILILTNRRAAIGEDAFRSDVLSAVGLDDRRSSRGYLSKAEQLMADAVGAEQAFFSTCGSSLSVKAAIDVSGLGISGYDAADWLREHQRVDMGRSDHRRIEATLSLADDDRTAARLMSALSALTRHASDLPRASQVELPSAAGLELEPAMLPITPTRDEALPSSGYPSWTAWPEDE
jgi:arginine/lysine/ornithine decarboxylase